MIEYRSVPLFGGGITTSLPSTFKDVSKYSVIPDHQEVWADEDTECKFIIELNERKRDLPNSSCSSFYFQDIALENQASQSNILSVTEHMPKGSWVESMATNQLTNSFSQWRHFLDVVILSSNDLEKDLKEYPKIPFIPFPLADHISSCSGEQSICRLSESHVVKIQMTIIRLVPPINTDIIVTFYSPVMRDEKEVSNMQNIEIITWKCLRTFCITNWALFCPQ